MVEKEHLDTLTEISDAIITYRDIIDLVIARVDIHEVYEYLVDLIVHSK